MGFFRPSPPAPPRPVIVDPFAVVPVTPANVQARRDNQGMIHLQLQVEMKGLRKKVADRLGYDYSRKLELDEYGSLYFSLVNGATPLKTIVDQMIARTGKSRQEVEQAVILFTKKLMTMNMIVLKVPADGGFTEGT